MADDRIERQVTTGCYPIRTRSRRRQRATAIREAGASKLVWLLEHPPLHTAGTSVDLARMSFP